LRRFDGHRRRGIALVCDDAGRRYQQLPGEKQAHCSKKSAGVQVPVNSKFYTAGQKSLRHQQLGENDRSAAAGHVSPIDTAGVLEMETIVLSTMYIMLHTS
jgi:hypothetical protein